MTVTLETTKEWLRVTHDTEDELITGFIETAEGIVEGILRFPLANYEGNVPKPVTHAIYYAVSKLYEERNELDMHGLTDVVRSLLFCERQVSW